jgi:hypothetical protein
MSEHSPGFLTVKSVSMGIIIVQPETAPAEIIEQASLVVFPFRMNEKNKLAAIEWAALSQTPIFCHSTDIPALVAEGFGAYRFHKLDGFREVDFQGGAIDFFPARRPKSRNLKGFVLEIFEWMGLIKAPSFHFAVRPKNEQPILFLGGGEFEATEWNVISKGLYEKVVGLNHSKTQPAWDLVSKNLGIKIESAPFDGTLVTKKTTQTVVARGIADPEMPEVISPKESELWQGSKAGAF